MVFVPNETSYLLAGRDPRNATFQEQLRAPACGNVARQSSILRSPIASDTPSRSRFIHEEGSAEERDFLEAAERLATIPGVEAFELLAEVSPKNGYRFGISMELAD
jgi:hypothetical protein